MTRKRWRFWLVVGGMSSLALAVALILFAFQDNLVFFLSPTELAAKAPPPTQRLRLGGLVEDGTVVRSEGGKTISFRVTDLDHEVTVTYTGLLPALFREGQGVVVEGTRGSDGVFRAVSVLAKHDEKYMPPEVAAALKKSGRWQEGQGGGPAKGAAAGSSNAPARVAEGGTGTTPAGDQPR